MQKPVLLLETALDIKIMSLQHHLKECYNDTKGTEALPRNKVCDDCGITFGKKFNRDRHIQNVHKGDIRDSILGIYDKGSALDSENTDKDILEYDLYPTTKQFSFKHAPY